MSTTSTTTRFDAEALRRGLAARDASAVLALYTDDAVIELVDARNTPSAPARIEGREAIRAHLEDVFGRDLTHELDLVAVDGDTLGYATRCRYADGTNVRCSSMAELR